MLPAAVAALACLCAASASPAEAPAPRPARSPAAQLTHPYAKTKDVQAILMSIDERLRTLDTVSAAQAIQARRLDAIQDKLERMESTISLRIEQAQLAAERLEHRIHVMQTNLQASLEASTARMERSQARVAAAALNLTRHLEPHRHLLDKVSGAYGETWRRGLVLEALTRDGLALVNVTRRELADGLRALARRQRESRLAHAELESAARDAVAALARRVDEHARRLDGQLQSAAAALDSCRRAQQDQPPVDVARVADVLDKLLDSFLNKTAMTFHELQVIQGSLLRHDNKVLRTLNTRPVQHISSETMMRRIESTLKNATAPSARESELQHLIEKFVDLTNRADEALQRLEARLSDDEDDSEDKSDSVAAADILIKKLNGIRTEKENDDEDIWADEADFFDDGGGGKSMEEVEKDMVSDTTALEAATARPPHRRHLHKHPYDRGPDTLNQKFHP